MSEEENSKFQKLQITIQCRLVRPRIAILRPFRQAQRPAEMVH